MTALSLALALWGLLAAGCFYLWLMQQRPRPTDPAVVLLQAHVDALASELSEFRRDVSALGIMVGLKPQKEKP